MNFLRKFFTRRQNPAPPVDSKPDSPDLLADMGYEKLEPRQVLSASFSFPGGELLLDAFDAGQDLTFSEGLTTINGVANVNSYIFDIGSAFTWTGSEANSNVELEDFGGGTDNRLEIATSFISSLTIDGTNIGISQGSSFNIDDFAISNITTNDTGFGINIGGNVDVGAINVVDSGNGDVDLDVTASGNITVSGTLLNSSTNALAGITLDANGTESDLQIDSSITTSAGSITLTADDDIAMGATGSLASVLTGGVSITANTDVADSAGGTDTFSMADGATISSATGDIDIGAIGVGAADVSIGSITSSGADVSITALGAINDGTAAEAANVSATSFVISGGSIGTAAAGGELDIAVTNLTFNSAGAVHITDLSGGLTVNGVSSAGSGELAANSPLTISANVNLAGSFAFTAGDDAALAGDNLTIDSGAVVTLTSLADAILDFNAGDDIVLDTGTIVTTGGGLHRVNLTADTEGLGGGVDADRGSVTNSTGLPSAPSVTTDTLVINASAGVGTPLVGGSEFRTEVTTLVVTNTDTGGVFIGEVDQINLGDSVLGGISNVGRDILIAAGGSINIANAVNAGTGDVRLIGNGDIHQTALGIITADELGVRQQATVYAAADDIDTNLGFDVILDDANDVNSLAATNAFDSFLVAADLFGVVVFSDVDDLTIDTVGAQVSGNNSFTATSGISTTFTGAAAQGGGDVADGDILINAGGFLQINQAVNAALGVADVRLIANGDIHQAATGIITADEFGVRQQATVYSAGNDIDVNLGFDIILDDANDVNFFGASNAFDANLVVADLFGVVVFNDIDGLTIATISAQTSDTVPIFTFTATAGVTTSFTGAAAQGVADVADGDILINADGFLQINAAVNAAAGAADVRLTADGDILQSAAGIITADELGVRQEATVYVAANDTDANLGFDIILDEANDIGFLAATNAFDSFLVVADLFGVVVFNDADDLTIDEVNAQTLGLVSFSTTTGVSTTYTGAAATGVGDVADGDILISAGGFLQINRDINAAAGAADVRLIADGNIGQDIVLPGVGVVIANEFGVRQESTGDIDLCGDNDVDIFAAFNNDGSIEFNILDPYLIGSVAAQTIGGVTFASSTGLVADGDIFLSSAGALTITEVISSGTGTVRLLASGDITQTAGSVITGAALGVRQIGTGAVIGAADIDANLRYDILLSDANDVDSFAAFNAFDDPIAGTGGVIVFNDTDGVTFGSVTALVSCGDTFALTNGISTTYTGAIVTGAGDSDQGDILIEAGGFLQISQAINAAAGTADVRLVANGDVHQAAAGTITANEFGVRQQATVYAAADDTDSNLGFDVILDDANDVDIVAASNAFDSFLVGADLFGVVVFNDVDDLTIDTVSAQTNGTPTFGATTGISTTFTGAAAQGGGDVADGDILINAGGFLQINQAVNAALGVADARLIANGDIHQSATGIITADEFGVRQQATVYSAGNDIDANLGFDIILDDANDVNFFGASNAFDSFLVGADLFGVVVFNDIDGLTIATISAQTSDTVPIFTFTATAGVTSSFTGAAVQGAGDVADGDILINADGFLQINAAVNAAAGAADVRLTADGDIHQSAAGIITADELGVRQEATVYSAANDIDANLGFDVILDDANDVNFLAAANNFDSFLVAADLFGVVVFQDTDGLTIDSVNTQTLGLATFATTTGVSTTFTGAAAQGGGDVADGDILINAGGFLQINQAVNAALGVADVRLIANGDIHQAATGIITADEFGVRQQATVYSAGNDIDANLGFDIILDDANDVNFFGASNAFDSFLVGADLFGVVVFNDIDGLTIATISAQTSDTVPIFTFTATAGVTTSFTGAAAQGVADVADGDILINADGFLQINAAVNAAAGAADVRLTADGDILQSAAGIITADELGVRQEATVYVAANDTDANLGFDIILDEANDIGFLAATNAFDSFLVVADLFGVVVFNDADDLTIDEVNAQTLGLVSFSTTTGVSTTYTGAAATGVGDVADGDILISAGGFLQINRDINAAAGAADVRLIADGNIAQDIVLPGVGVVIANEFGVRQESTGDIDLCGDNDVDIFAAFNNDGSIEFNILDPYIIGNVPAQTIGNITFTDTTGINANGDIFLTSTGSLTISTAINAGTGTVRLLANGDITQTAGSTITADALGVRQLGTGAVVGANDLDGNLRYDILLSDLNDVNTFAAFNAFDDPIAGTGGVIVFNDIDDLAIGSVALQNFCTTTFVLTNGVSTTYTGAIATGAGDSDQGDILIQSGGALQLSHIINAATGTSDVRLIANGDVHQTAAGTIRANELGVRQQATVYGAANDTDANLGFDVILDDANDVDIVAINNAFDSFPVAADLFGVVVFSDVDDLTIDLVTAQANGTTSFLATNGITTTFTGAAAQGGGDVADGDILINAGGFLQINQAVNAALGVADVRLIANGDIHQAATGIITADEFGVRQQATVYSAGNDIDANLGFDIILDDANDVSFFGASNAFDSFLVGADLFGVVVFNDIDGLTIATISAQTSDTVPIFTFAATAGVTTSFTGAAVQGAGDVADGDILINADGFLQINAAVNAASGVADVRLVADGDILQSATGTITADEFGVRQEATVYVAANDIDGNLGFDIILDETNDVGFLAARNTFDSFLVAADLFGVVVFNDADDLTIAAVSAQTIGLPTFTATTGVTTVFTGAAAQGAGDVSDGDILINAGGFLQINSAINAAAGVADVRVIANGDIHQSAAGTITASELGVRQQATLYSAAGDIDGNLGFDIILDNGNDVDFFGASNAFDSFLVGADSFGVLVFNDVDNLTIATISAQTSDTVPVFTFTATAGVTTSFTGAAVQGAGDVADGDILINAGGFLQINSAINAGTADVRLIGNGDIHQTAAGTIAADELGVRQQATLYSAADDIDGNLGFDIILDDANDVGFLGGRNAFDSFLVGADLFGMLVFNDVDDLTIATISAQSSDTVPVFTFTATTGLTTAFTGASAQGAGDVNDGDILVNAGGFIQINSAIVAASGRADVRLVANGDIHQAVAGTITASELGVRQQATVFGAGNDIDANGGFDIILDDANDVDFLGATNSFDSVANAGSQTGRLVFSDIDNLTIDTISTQTVGLATFGTTTGLTTTFTGAAAQGAGDVADGDILINTGGFLQINQAVNAALGVADVRLIANGDIHQSVTGIITADELGVRQQATAAVVPGTTNDIDGNLGFDIILDDANDVDFFGASNVYDSVANAASQTGVVVFNDVDDLTVSTVSAQTSDTVPVFTFATTTGVTTAFTGATGQGVGDVNDGDILINAGGFLQIDSAINAALGVADVRLVANGDIHQAVAGTITADELGVRQQGAVFGAANDIDANGGFDVILDDANDVNFFGGRNAFDSVANAVSQTGVMVFNDVDGLTIDTVSAQAIGLSSFATTTGVTTTFTGAVAQGAADVNDGDILITAGGFLQINQTVNAASGVADVRLSANGDIHQTATGTITADELGVRQLATVFVAGNDLDANGGFDIILDDGNDVGFLGATNLFDSVANVASQTGVVVFNDIDDLTIDSVSAQTIGLSSYAATTGVTTTFTGAAAQGAGDVNDGDILINAGGFLQINQAVNAALGVADARLIANGDIHQSASGTITADELGIRQQATVFNAANDIDGNGGFDVILDDANDVDFVSASNAFDSVANAASESGVVVFSDIDDLAISETTGQTIGLVAFGTTTGITTTFTGAAAQGGTDVDDGDILINAGGFLQINQPINAATGLADVRLIANGDIHQTAIGIIIADELGVRQVDSTYSAGDDLDANTQFDIHLCFNNQVDFFAADNQFAIGQIVFSNADDFDIADIVAQTIGNVVFAQTTGISTVNGDIYVESAGAMDLVQDLNAGTANIRLVADGDIRQAATSSILADQLGVRQESNAFVASNDLDGNGRYDVILDNLGNDVNTLAIINLFDEGVIAFRDLDDLTIGLVTTQAYCDKTFLTTTGVITTFTLPESTTDDGDILINAGGFLQLDRAVNAAGGVADVRLIANGDIHQAATGTIRADELGVRQQGTVFAGGNDLDANTRFDVLLDQGNDVDTLAVVNLFDSGSVTFNDSDDLTIDLVGTQTLGTIGFAPTTGLLTTFTGAAAQGDANESGDILLNADGFLQINRSINAAMGVADARLVADGDILQATTGTIIADELGVRQEATVYVAGNDVDANGGFDIILDDANDVNFLAATNTFDSVANVLSESGVLVFNDSDDLTIDSLTTQVIGAVTFAPTTGLSTTYMGAVVAGGTDVCDGDILINADGFLQINQAVIAAGGTSDVRIAADGDIAQTATGTITANELGIRQQATALSGVNDIDANSRHDIRLLDGNDVDILAMNNAHRPGDLEFNDIDNLTIDGVTAKTYTVGFAATNGVISDDGTTGLDLDDGRGTIRLTAGTRLDDGLNTPIVTEGSAVFSAGTKILLANDVGDRLHIGNADPLDATRNAQFISPDIEVGQDSAAAGSNFNVLFETLTVNDEPVGDSDLNDSLATADITEDDTSILSGNNSTGTLVLTSGNNIFNTVGTTIDLDSVQFNAVNNVFVGNRTGDTFGRFNSGVAAEITIGIFANQASLGVDSAVELVGSVPLNPALNQDHATGGAGVFALGTAVTNSLFVSSEAAGNGHIEQTVGSLNAGVLGLVADRHIHLVDVAATNRSIAATSGESIVVNPGSLSARLLALDALGADAIEGSEVRNQQLSFAIAHQGTLTVDSVANPDTIGETNAADQVGITTLAATNASMYLGARDGIVINDDISATSANAFPQVTVNVFSGVNDATRIQFNNASITVTGLANVGIVNNSQTTAEFFENPGARIPFDGTTEIVRLEGGAVTAEQFIRIKYGAVGETGYRIGFVWDSQRRFTDPGLSQEDPNFFSTNVDGSEVFDVRIEDQSVIIPPPPFLNIDPTAPRPTITTLIESVAPNAPFFNFDTLFGKLDPYTLLSLEARNSDPVIFTTIDVRNDQDINLFVGTSGVGGTVDNSLNQVTEVLESRLESNAVYIPSTPSRIEPNAVQPLRVRQIEPEQPPFIPPQEPVEVERPDDPGRLSWVPVEINGDEMIKIGDELILKTPDKDYEAETDATAVELKGLNKNEIQKIIRQIENDETAEAGVWYKIFIDYTGESGKKDETIFYYYKTGQESQDDLGPESDFKPDNAPQIQENPVPQNDGDAGGDGNPDDQLSTSDTTADHALNGLVSPLIAVDSAETSTANDGGIFDNGSGTGRTALGISTGAMLLATLAAKQRRGEMDRPADAVAASEEVSFSRFGRLKRRVAALMGKK